MMSLCADILFQSNSELVKQVKLKFKRKKCDLSD